MDLTNTDHFEIEPIHIEERRQLPIEQRLLLLEECVNHLRKRVLTVKQEMNSYLHGLSSAGITIKHWHNDLNDTRAMQQALFTRFMKEIEEIRDRLNILEEKEKEKTHA